MATFRRADHILWDFDGPLVALFAQHDAASGTDLPLLVADEFRVMLEKCGVPVGPFEGSRDPYGIYQSVGARSAEAGDEATAAELLRRMRDRLDHLDEQAALTATLTEGAYELVKELAEQGKRLAVASNNHTKAIEACLSRADLANGRLISYFSGRIIGRPDHPAKMKPNPACLYQATECLGEGSGGPVDPASCLMIGDSSADALAAAQAGIPFCGYAPDAGKRRVLTSVGARDDMIVTNLGACATALGRLVRS
ncbi:HAD hydrolase-like protein [Streptomyces sp. ME19-03-3]|nr:HAD hydrolase-like protein [Streptomyces sp. ME19-03-3]